MVNPWRKYKNASIKKKQVLHSLIAGLALFCILCVIGRVFGISVCLSRAIFDVACPGCGLSRAFLSILSFDIIGAVEYHVLSVPLFLAILSYSMICVTDILFDRDDIARIENALRRKSVLILLFIVLLIST